MRMRFHTLSHTLLTGKGYLSLVGNLIWVVVAEENHILNIVETKLAADSGSILYQG
jgi:hypothetical protein